MHSYVLCDAFTLLKVYKKESFQSFCETGKVSQTMAVSYVSLPLLQIISMDLKSHRSCNYVLRLNLRQPLGTEIKFMYTLLFQSSIYVIQTHTYFYTESLMHFSYDITANLKYSKMVIFFNFGQTIYELHFHRVHTMYMYAFCVSSFFHQNNPFLHFLQMPCLMDRTLLEFSICSNTYIKH